jgi:hypothetical protein
MAVETVPFVLTPGPSVWGPRVALPSLGRIRKLLLSPLTHGFRIFHFVLRVGVFSADALVFRGRLFFVRPWRWGRFASFLFRQTPRVLVCMPFDALPSERVYQCIAGPSWKQERTASAGLVSVLVADRHPRGDARAGRSGFLRPSLVPLTARRSLNVICRGRPVSLGLAPASLLSWSRP